MTSSVPFPDGSDGQVFDALQAIGRVLSTASVFGPDHFRTADAARVAVAALAGVLNRGRLQVALIEDRLHVDGRPIEARQSPLIRVIEARLQSLKATGFTIDRGLEDQELLALVRVLISAKAGEFENTLQKAGLAHVRAEKVVWKAVTPSEAGQTGVGSTVTATRGRAVRPAGRETETAGGGPARKDTSVVGGGTGPKWDDARVQQIIAFLRGAMDAETPGIREGLRESFADVDRLASLIFHAAVIHQIPASVQDGETLADVVIGCLRRAYAGARDAETVRGGVRRPEMRKALLLLEAQLLERLHKWMGREDPELDARIARGIEELRVESEIDQLASQWLEQQQSLDRLENRLRRAVAVHGAERVEQALERTGVPPVRWRRVIVGCEESPPASATAGAAPALDLPPGLGALALVLERFEQVLRSETGRGEAEQLAHTIRQGVEEAAQHAVAEIERLGRHLENARSAALGKTASEMSRAELTETLASLAQDLLQPLTVIQCSLSMLLRNLGNVGEEDRGRLLQMAHESAERLNQLMQRLIGIVGYPRNLGGTF